MCESMSVFLRLPVNLHMFDVRLCVDPLSLTERLQPSLYGRPRESLRGRQVPAREWRQSEPPHRGQLGLLSCILCVGLRVLLVSPLLSWGYATRYLQSKTMAKQYYALNEYKRFICCW